MTPDPSKRFSATPLEARLTSHGMNLRVATNHQGLRDRLRSHFPPSACCLDDIPVFSLRIIVEPEDEFNTLEDDFCVYDFELDGLGYVTIGRTSFFAYDRKSSQGFSFVTSRLVGDDTQFHRYFLEALRSMLQRIGAQQ